MCIIATSFLAASLVGESCVWTLPRPFQLLDERQARWCAGSIGSMLGAKEVPQSPVLVCNALVEEPPRLYTRRTTGKNTCAASYCWVTQP